jgi:hypothetical protein
VTEADRAARHRPGSLPGSRPDPRESVRGRRPSAASRRRSRSEATGGRFLPSRSDSSAR